LLTYKVTALEASNRSAVTCAITRPWRMSDGAVRKMKSSSSRFVTDSAVEDGEQPTISFGTNTDSETGTFTPEEAVPQTDGTPALTSRSAAELPALGVVSVSSTCAFTVRSTSALFTSITGSSAAWTIGCPTDARFPVSGNRIPMSISRPSPPGALSAVGPPPSGLSPAKFCTSSVLVVSSSVPANSQMAYAAEAGSPASLKFTAEDAPW
jgi:hypothetical protein